MQSWHPPPRIVAAIERGEREPETGGYPYFCAVLKLGRPELVAKYLRALDAAEPGSAARTLDAAAAGEPIFTGYVPIHWLGGPESYRDKLDAAIRSAWGELAADFHATVGTEQIEGYGWPEHRDAERREPLPLSLVPRLDYSGLDAKSGWRHYSNVLFYRPARSISGERVRVKAGEVNRAAVELLEKHASELVKTNGLLAAAAAILGMMDMEKPVEADTVRRYIEDRFWELAHEMGIEPSPTSPRSKRPR